MVPPLTKNAFMKINTMETVWFIGKALVNTRTIKEILVKKNHLNCFEAICIAERKKKEN